VKVGLGFYSAVFQLRLSNFHYRTLQALSSTSTALVDGQFLSRQAFIVLIDLFTPLSHPSALLLRAIDLNPFPAHQLQLAKK
jgi:hypothetical protein